MSQNDKEIYLRVLADLPFMLEILKRADEQTDEFTVEMLRQRILLERHTVNVEEDRKQREQAERNAGYQAEVERRTDD